MPRTDPVDDLTDAVLTASRLLLAVSARSVAAVDDTITLPQLRLLVVLDTKGPVKLIELAEHLAVNPSTATRMVDRLTAAGRVVRTANPATRREVILELTDEGRRVVREVTEHRREEIHRIVARMEPSTRQGLVDALNAFAAAGGEPSTAEPSPDLAWSPR
jgi:DNA-binding MarR family transcriptional regulator